MKKMLFMLMTVSFMFVSCDSDSTTQEPTKQESLNTQNSAKPTQGLKSLRDKVLADNNQGGKIYYSSIRGVVFSTKTKTTIVIPPGSIMTKDGKKIDGDIEIDYIEIFNKKTMVVANKPTMGQLVNSTDKGLLTTGGEFYLDIKFNGQQVNVVTPIKVNINTSNSSANPAGMSLWNGAINGNDDLTWNAASTSDLEFEQDGAVFGGKSGTGVYDVLVNNSSNFGWCNIDRLSSWPGIKTKIKVIPPTGFDQSNSSVYLAVKGEDNMLAQFDMFYTATNTFEEHYGLVPIGLECHIIFVGEQNGNYVYHILSTAIGNNATYTVPATGLTTTTNYSQLENAISLLP